MDGILWKLLFLLFWVIFQPLVAVEIYLNHLEENFIFLKNYFLYFHIILIYL
jgi:hypothetical protein